jgi:toxin ParE1/3/4
VIDRPTIKITQKARQDLRSIYRYIAQDNPHAARRVIEQLQATIHLLARNPHMGLLRSHLQQGLRTFTSGSYIIFYQPLNTGVNVVHIIHGARDIENLLDE